MSARAEDFQTLAALQALAAGQQGAAQQIGAQENAAWLAQQQQVLMPELAAAFSPAQMAQLAQLGQLNPAAAAAVSQSGALLSPNALTQLQLRVRSMSLS